MKRVFDNIKLFIVVLLPLGTGVYGFILGGEVAAAIWGWEKETGVRDMWVNLAIAAPFGLIPYWLSKWILKKLGLES